MFYVLGFVFVLLMCFCVTFRTCMFHPISTIFYGVKDTYEFFAHKKFNECEVGQIIAYCGLFGLALQCNTPSDMDAVANVSRKWKRRHQKRTLI